MLTQEMQLASKTSRCISQAAHPSRSSKPGYALAWETLSHSKKVGSKAELHASTSQDAVRSHDRTRDLRLQSLRLL